MKRILNILLFFSFFFTISLEAQNLIANPSFEYTVNCPTTIGQLNYAQFWVNPTQSSPDYFNFCSTVSGNAVHVPNNGFGTQAALDGVAYAGFYTFNKSFPNVREYIQTNLTTPLTLNTKYLVSFYVSLSDWSQYSITSIGAYFSSIPISSTNTLVLNYSPQIQNKSTNMLSDKNNWMLVSDTLVSDGTEQYITIGNFKKDSLSDTLFLGSMGGKQYCLLLYR